MTLGHLPRSRLDTPLLVVVNDPDRATDTAPVLRSIAERAAGRTVRVLVATGSHVHDHERRARHESALRAAAPGAEIRWHRGDEDVPHVGRACDPWFAAAHDVVGIGSVEPHWFAGLTGSYKTLSIGVLPPREIVRSHRLATSRAARPLVLAGNPVHEEIAATFRDLTRGKAVLGLDLLGDTLIAGDPLANVASLLSVAAARWGRAVREAVDVLHCRVAPPLDRSLYQAEKAIKNSEHAVRDGGVIVLEAACPDGVGPRRFFDLLAAAPDATAARDHVAEHGYHLGDHKAVRWRALQERGVRVLLVSADFPVDDARIAGLHVVPDRAAAAAWLRATVGDATRSVIVEDAAHTVIHVSQ